jgi:hypothetical protein
MHPGTAISLTRALFRFLSGLGTKPRLLHLLLLTRSKYRPRYFSALAKAMQADVHRNEALVEKLLLENLQQFSTVVRESFPKDANLRRTLILRYVRNMRANVRSSRHQRRTRNKRRS